MEEESETTNENPEETETLERRVEDSDVINEILEETETLERRNEA